MKLIKYILFFAMLMLLGSIGYGQTITNQGNTSTLINQFGGIGADKWLRLPLKNAPTTSTRKHGFACIDFVGGLPVISLWDTATNTWVNIVSDTGSALTLQQVTDNGATTTNTLGIKRIYLGDNTIAPLTANLFSLVDSTNPTRIAIFGNIGYNQVGFNTGTPTTIVTGTSGNAIVKATNTVNHGTASSGHANYVGIKGLVSAEAGAAGVFPSVASVYGSMTGAAGVTYTKAALFNGGWSSNCNITRSMGVYINQNDLGTLANIGFYHVLGNETDPPNGNWGFYDSTGYVSYFRGGARFGINPNSLGTSALQVTGIQLSTDIDNYTSNLGSTYTARTKTDKNYVDSSTATRLSTSAISGTNNMVVKYTSGTTIGNSSTTDDGTTVTVTAKEIINTGTVVTGGNGFKTTATMPATLSNNTFANLISVTGGTTSQTATQNSIALKVEYTAGTNVGVPVGIQVINSSTSTTNNAGPTSGNISYRPQGNLGASIRTEGTTTGAQIGTAVTAGGGDLNIGGWSSATVNKDNAVNVGGAFFGRNSNSGGTQVGVFASLADYGTVMPTWGTGAAAIFDNAATTSNILELRDNGTSVVKVVDGGSVGIGATTPATILNVRTSAATAGTGYVLNEMFNNSDAPYWSSTRARGTSGSPTATQSGDDLGGLTFKAYNGSSNVYGAGIFAQQTGSASTTIPSKIYVLTGDGSTVAERLSVSSTSVTATVPVIGTVLRGSSMATGASSDDIALIATGAGELKKSGVTLSSLISTTNIASTLLNSSQTAITATGGLSLASTYAAGWRKADATAAPVTITITFNTAGQEYTIKRIDASINALTLQLASGNIDGSATYVVPLVLNQATTIYWDGAQGWLK